MDPVPAAVDPRQQSFTVLDWIGTLITGSTITGLMLLPVASFGAMHQDLASAETLPLLTRVALFPGFPALVALAPLALFALGLRARRRLSQRRVFIVAAFTLACLGSALCLVAMYLPLFEVAGRIKAD